MQGTTRRRLLGAGAAAGTLSQFRHPGTRRTRRRLHAALRQQPARQPSDECAREADGRAHPAGEQGPRRLMIFPNNQLGGDTDMLSQIRSGRDRLLHPVGADPRDAGAGRRRQRRRLRLQGLRPGLAGDGRRARRACARRDRQGRPDRLRRRCGTTASARSPPARSRSTPPTTSSGVKIRVPVMDWTSMFKAFGASPHGDQLQRGLLGAADQGGRRAGEPAGASSRPAKLYEVQKYCSLTNHMWDGFWFLANARVSATPAGRPAGDRRQAT